MSTDTIEPAAAGRMLHCATKKDCAQMGVAVDEQDPADLPVAETSTLVEDDETDDDDWDEYMEEDEEVIWQKNAWTRKKENEELVSLLEKAARAIGVAHMSYTEFMEILDKDYPKLTEDLRASKDKLLGKAGSKHRSKLERVYDSLSKVAAAEQGIQHMKESYARMVAEGHPLTKMNSEEFMQYLAKANLIEELSVPLTKENDAAVAALEDGGSQGFLG